MGQSGQPDLSGATAVRIEFLVVDLMNRLLAARPGEVDQAIDASLAEIGRACSLDRTFVFRFDEATGYSNTHEWVAPGIKALKGEMHAISADLCPAWHAELLAGRVVEVSDRNLLPGNSPERALLERIGVHASLKVPMRDGDRLFGVIGYDCNDTDGHWSDACRSRPAPEAGSDAERAAGTCGRDFGDRSDRGLPQHQVALAVVSGSGGCRAAAARHPPAGAGRGRGSRNGQSGEGSAGAKSAGRRTGFAAAAQL
jgi:hypothetical protein